MEYSFMSVRQSTGLVGHSCPVHLINGVDLETVQGMYNEVLPKSNYNPALLLLAVLTYMLPAYVTDVSFK